MTDDAELRQRAIEAAATLILREGIGAATHERVATEAGVRERQVRKWFPDIDDLRAHVLSIPQFSESADLVARAAASPEPVNPLPMLVEVWHRLYAGAANNWSGADLELLVRASANEELRDLAREHIQQRTDNARKVIARGKQVDGIDPDISVSAMTHFGLALSVGLAILHPVATAKPSYEEWDAFTARLGMALAGREMGEPFDLGTSRRWHLLIDIPERPGALSRLVRALGSLSIYVNDVRVEQGQETARTIYLGLLAPQDVSADVILAAASSAGTNGHIKPASPEDARDVMTRTLDGAAYLVKHPDQAPMIAAALVAADSFEVVEAAEGLNAKPGVLRLQWTPDRHVVLRRDWCPFTRSEQLRASALLRLSSAIARMSGSDEQSGWVDPIKGGTVWIRLGHPDDAEAVAQMHERSSERTIYLRYFTNVEWRESQLGRLSGGHRGATLVATADDKIVGLGNVFPEGPPEEGTAEIAVIVEDEYQGRGVGRVLLRRMLEVAPRLGFTSVAAHMIGDNVGIKRLLDSTELQWSKAIHQGIAEWTAALPAPDESAVVE